MALLIWSIDNRVFKLWMIIHDIRTGFYDDCVIIAKGNVFEGIEATEKEHGLIT